MFSRLLKKDRPRQSTRTRAKRPLSRHSLDLTGLLRPATAASDYAEASAGKSLRQTLELSARVSGENQDDLNCEHGSHKGHQHNHSHPHGGHQHSHTHDGCGYYQNVHQHDVHQHTDAGRYSNYPHEHPHHDDRHDCCHDDKYYNIQPQQAWHENVVAVPSSVYSPVNALAYTTHPLRHDYQAISTTSLTQRMPADPVSSEESITALPQKTVKEEKPVTELETNHVVLDVQGLTCTGCKADLSRALQKIPGVDNLRTSLMLARAEFDLHDPEVSLDELIKSVERSTGFTLSPRQADGDFKTLDLIVNDIHKNFMLKEKVNGVQDITKLDKRTIRISYDPNVIGARTLLIECLDQVIDLAPAHSKSTQEASRQHLHTLARTTVISILLTIPVLVLAWARLPPHLVAYQSTSFVLATIIQIFVAGPFYPPTLRALILHHVLEADLLIVVSTSAAYILSVVDYIYLLAAGHAINAGGAETTYFQASTLLITLVMVGRTLSAYARQKVIDFISTKSLQAQTANLCTIKGRFVEELDVRLLQYGDYFLVHPNTCVPTDGIIVSGTTEVDESQVTGESMPVSKDVGSSVLAGSWNRSSIIVVRLTQLTGMNTISKINAAVDEAKFSKTHTAQVVDRVGGFFVPIVLCLTVITFGIWLAIGMAVRYQSGREAAITAVTYALAVLIISCP